MYLYIYWWSWTCVYCGISLLLWVYSVLSWEQQHTRHCLLNLAVCHRTNKIQRVTMLLISVPLMIWGGPEHKRGFLWILLRFKGHIVHIVWFPVLMLRVFVVAQRQKGLSWHLQKNCSCRVYKLLSSQPQWRREKWDNFTSFPPHWQNWCSNSGWQDRVLYCALLYLTL